MHKDENGNVVSSIPNKAGTYTIEAAIAGDSTYEKCSQTASYTIELPDLITLDVPSKVYDGKPANLNYSVNYDKDYTVKAHYKGTVPYAAEITYNYDSDDAPITPGRYKVTLTAYDKATGTAISSKTKDFEITFKSTTLPGTLPDKDPELPVCDISSMQSQNTVSDESNHYLQLSSSSDQPVPVR